jgi:tetratricopeptide (TPR) repeat protein
VTTASDCAEALAEGRARVLLGQLSCLSGRFDEADREAERALILGMTAKDPLTSSYAPNLRGMIALIDRRFEECAAYHTTAIEAFRDDGNLHGEAAALSNLSRPQIEFGDTDAAIASSEQSVAVYRDLHAGYRLGNGLYTLAVALTASDRLNEALAALSEALPIFREARQQFWEGMTLFRMAEVHLAAGRNRQSASLAEQALALLREVGGEWRMANALTLLGQALSQIGQPDRASACWRDALAVFTALDRPEAEEVRQLLGDPAAPSIAV